MEENVALDSAKQKDFLKSVKGIKQLLKKKVKKPDSFKAGTPKTETKQITVLKKRQDRGLVYLSHIPHGFYEQQMSEYFKQFGVVTNVRVIRSRRTGKSKGFAFVEFKDTEVAQVVAETMNNYLMGKRLIKAAYIPPNKQRTHALRKKWNPQHHPSMEERLKFKKMHNASKTDDEDLKTAKKLLFNLSKTKKKLSNLGIDYNFFEPVDVPEALKDELNNVTLTDKKSKKQMKTEFQDIKSEDEILEIKPESEEKTEKKMKNKLKRQQSEKVTSNSKETNKPQIKNDNGIVDEENSETEDGNKLKKADVKAPENFISIKDADNSDSSIDFDSDEFEKMMENDDDLSAGSENTETENEDVESDESDLPKTVEIQESKNRKNAIPSLNNGKGTLVSGVQKKQEKRSAPTQAIKRKLVQSSPVTDKKFKFGKQKRKKPLNKVTKKRA